MKPNFYFFVREVVEEVLRHQADHVEIELSNKILSCYAVDALQQVNLNHSLHTCNPIAMTIRIVKSGIHVRTLV